MNSRELAAMRRKTIMQLNQEGLSSIQISKQVAMDPSNVRKIIHKYQDNPEKAGTARNQNKKYDYELKQNAVELHIFAHHTLEDICKTLGIHSVAVLNNWCNLARKNNGSMPAPRLRGRAKRGASSYHLIEKPSIEKKLLELERAIKYLEMENTLLKKFHQTLRGW